MYENQELNILFSSSLRVDKNQRLEIIYNAYLAIRFIHYKLFYKPKNIFIDGHKVVYQKSS